MRHSIRPLVVVLALVITACGGDDQAGVVDTIDSVEDLADSSSTEIEVDETLDSDDTDTDTNVEDTSAEDTRDVEVVPECGDCDDGLACTQDGCGVDGVCRHTLQDGFCAIAGKCVTAGFGSDCQVCAPQSDPTHYTPLTGGPCDDDDPCTHDEQCLGGICRGGIAVACPVPDACHTSLGCGDAGCVEEARRDGSVCGSGKVCDDEVCIDGDAYPAGTIAFFDRTTCPVGWSLASALVGRTAVPIDGARVGGEDGIGGGAALASGEDRTHTHSFSGSGTIDDQSFAGIAGGGNGLASSGAVTIGVSGQAASSGLPYTQFLPCEKTASERYGAMPEGLFVHVDRTSCPDDWSASIAGFDRLLVGAPVGASAGASFGATTPTAHAHTLSGTVSTPAHGIALASGCCASGFASSSGVKVTISSDAATLSFPWLGVLQCEVPAPVGILPPLPEPDAAPPGMLAWSMTSACPPGWSVHAGARGRLLVGAALGGDVGLTVGTALGDKEDRTHTHPVAITATLTQKNIAAANGPNNSGAGPGTVSATLTSAPAASGLRFLQRTACVKAP